MLVEKDMDSGDSEIILLGYRLYLNASQWLIESMISRNLSVIKVHGSIF
jgi:hypothetical protein